MRKILLKRTRKAGMAVFGELSFEMRNRNYDMERFTHPTLENADFIIPAGTYPVALTWSPKFKKFLPEIQNVPDRTGIRIHRGSLITHSKGCILLDLVGMSNITCLFNQLKFAEEDAEITITDPQN